MILKYYVEMWDATERSLSHRHEDYWSTSSTDLLWYPKYIKIFTWNKLSEYSWSSSKYNFTVLNFVSFRVNHSAAHYDWRFFLQVSKLVSDCRVPPDMPLRVVLLYPDLVFLAEALTCCECIEWKARRQNWNVQSLIAFVWLSVKQNCFSARFLCFRKSHYESKYCAIMSSPCSWIQF